MSAFIDTFRKSFSSAVPSDGGRSSIEKQRSRHKSKKEPVPSEDEYQVYAEMQILKVTAPKQDLEKFAEKLIRAKETAGIGVQIQSIHPSRRHDERLKRMEEEEKENHDFLDHVFSDKIPFLHDFLVYGSPEAQFFQIKGKRGEVDDFNQLCTKVIHGEELQCKLEVTDRRKLSIKKKFKTSILGGPNSKPDFLDAIFTDDISGCNPFLHTMILSAY